MHAYRTTLLVTGILIFVMPVALVAKEGEHSSTVNAIKTEVARIKEFEKANPDKLKALGIVEEDNRLKLVETPQPMPAHVLEQSEATYYVLYDNTGRVLSHQEIPTSRSGDWYAHYLHYFDNTGNTMMYEFHSASFNSGCAGILRITKRYYYDKGFGLIKETQSYTDRDKNDAPVDIQKCDLYGVQRAEPTISPTYIVLEERLRKDLIEYRDMRIRYQQMMAEMEERWRKIRERNFVYMVGGYKRVVPFVALTLLLLVFLFRRKIWK